MTMIFLFSVFFVFVLRTTLLIHHLLFDDRYYFCRKSTRRCIIVHYRLICCKFKGRKLQCRLVKQTNSNDDIIILPLVAKTPIYLIGGVYNMTAVIVWDSLGGGKGCTLSSLLSVSYCLHIYKRVVYQFSIRHS